jgi:hypothetical protein
MEACLHEVSAANGRGRIERERDSRGADASRLRSLPEDIREREQSEDDEQRDHETADVNADASHSLEITVPLEDQQVRYVGHWAGMPAYDW